MQDIRGFLLKQKLPVPSPDVIPQLSSRLGTDPRFRADVASLMRAILFEEREGIGYEDLLGILVAAAAGTEHDLTSASQEADIREMLRFLLQSRGSTFRADPEEVRDAVEPEARVMAPVSAVPASARHVGSEPVLRARGAQSTAYSMKLELKPDEPGRDVEKVKKIESRESADPVLPAFRTTGLFAAQMETEAVWWRVHSVWAVGIICMLVGVGLGLSIHRVVSAAEMHAAVRAANSSSSKPSTAIASNGANQNVPALGSRPSATRTQPRANGLPTESPAGAAQTASIAGGDHAGVQPAAALEGRSTPPVAIAGPPATIAGKGSAVPMTVVEQVVTASRSPSADSGGSTDAAQFSAKTRSIVPQRAAGITPANVIFSPAPEYPAAAAAARVHGQVTVHAVVDPDGNVIYARAVSGPPLLRDAAEEAVHHWRYSPLLDNGKPIAVTTMAIVDFKFAK